jgi:crotonobetainyl-CoA:carnitine CoA-transferase CaiB-like acyl-CoA transferase
VYTKIDENEEALMRGSLDGIRVLEAASFIAGPYCAMMLADQGADVIKVERPGSGDENRAEPPFFKGESAPFMLWNRNKRSVTLDLKVAEDKERFLKLVDTADVLIENFRTGAMDRLGFGYEELALRNPRLIYASVTGYGGTGPLSKTGGFDLVLQGFTGLMALSGGEHEGPHRLPIPICDIASSTRPLPILRLVRRRRNSDKSIAVSHLTRYFPHPMVTSRLASPSRISGFASANRLANRSWHRIHALPPTATA